MPCSACAKRRKKLEALRAKKKAKGQRLQAAAITGALAVTKAVGDVVGINGEVEDGRISAGSEGPEPDSGRD